MVLKGQKPFLSPFLLGVGLVLIPTQVWADTRALTFDFETTGEYGRIITSWSDGSETAPSFSADLLGPVMVLRFDEPVDFDTNELSEGLPAYIAVARLNEDGTEARLAMSREFRIHQSTSYDLTAIDFVLPGVATDPADIMSPLAEQKKREAEAAAAAAEAKRLANLPPILDVKVRGSESQDYSTLAFYWPEDIDFTSRNLDGDLEITFSRRGRADLAPVRVDPPTGMKTVESVNTENSWITTIDVRDGYWASPIKVDQAILVRIREGDDPGQPVVEDAVLPVALQKLSETLPPPPDPYAAFEAPARKPFEFSPLDEPPAKEEDPPEAEYLSDQVYDEDPVQQASIVKRRLWNEALDGTGSANVTLTPKSRGLNIDIAFQDDIPGAVFRHNGQLWIAFPANGRFDLGSEPGRAGFKISQSNSDEGMALQVAIPDDLIVSVTESGRLWSVSIGSSGRTNYTQLSPERTASRGGSGIVVDVPNVGTVFDIFDQDVGSSITIVPALEHTVALNRSLRFVEASLPTTVQGLAIIPFVDDMTVSQRGTQILISRETGLALSSWGVDAEVGPNDTLTPGFLDFASWRRGDMNSFWLNQSRLSSAAALSDLEDWSGQTALLDLTRFYLAWQLAPEAYGPLQIVESVDPIYAEDAHWITLHSAADVMVGRFNEAVERLEKGSVRSDAGASAWRGLAYSELGDWRKSRSAFLEADPLIDAFIPEWSGLFHAHAARANVRMGDFKRAEIHAESAQKQGGATAKGIAMLSLAEIAENAGRNQDAAIAYTRLLDHKNPKIQVRAELASIMLAQAQGKMSALDASDRLDSLRFRWRGDALELEIVAALSDTLFDLGQFRESLQLTQAVAMQFPDLPGARLLRIKMMEQFEAIFLDGKDEEIDPIIALALFYEFRDLTPIGPDGDRMIRKLANRLVAFDLLDPATELLSHQVDNRNLIGAGRAKIAADLAAIYLLDDRPELALRTIATTRQTGLSDDIRLERRMLEAAAHMELNRHGHAIELLEGLSDPAATMLLSEVYWRSRNWQAAGESLHKTLPQPGNVLSLDQARSALRAAVAYRMDGNYAGLQRLRDEYLNVMLNTSEAESFDLLTGAAESSIRLTDMIRNLADTSSADAFVENLKQRFGEG